MKQIIKRKLLLEMNKISAQIGKEIERGPSGFCPHGWRLDALEYCDECQKKERGEQ